MNCPHCGVEVDEHPASWCMDLWVEQTLHPEGLATIVIPLYSTQISAAWMVVERLRDKGWAMTIENNCANDCIGVLVEPAPEEDYEEDLALVIRAETAPLAIVRAALKAVDNRPKAE